MLYNYCPELSAKKSDNYKIGFSNWEDKAKLS